jgi:hypothetical protein
VAFFGVDTARTLRAERGAADLIVANNVLAQVPDLNDFVAGIGVLLGERGVVTVEFPHLDKLIEGNQFDTIYHEHFSYFSFHAARAIFGAHGLTVFDVEPLRSHGGSLRLYARHANDASKPITDRARHLQAVEEAAGITTASYYASFAGRVHETKRRLLDVLIRAKRQGLAVAGYGAPGKGNTLLNYCGIRTDFLDYTVDRSPYKQGKYLPGTHIPIVHPDRIAETRPDLVMIVPWNLEKEITEQLAHIRGWGGRFLVPIPDARVVD